MIRATIDPGHGGNSRSNRGSHGYIEADGVLDISLKLKTELLSTGEFQVFMTRDKDTTVDLRQRGYIGGKNKSDLFISEHTDAGPASAGGCSVFYSIDISSDKTLAANICNSVSGALGITARGAKTRVLESNPNEDYYGVIDAAQDSGCKHVILIESAFHTNEKEEKMLLDASKRLAIAKAQAAAICNFFGVTYPANPKPKTTPKPAPSPVHPILKRGSKGAAVVELQHSLNRTEKYGLVEDGSFGPATESAIKKFQKKYKLVVDGIAGPKTWKKIDELVSKLNKPATKQPIIRFRVRKSWKDAESQIGAFEDFENAKSCADDHADYFVFDADGIQIYPKLAVPQKTTTLVIPYRVKINWDDPIEKQKGAYNILDNAEECADENAADGYKVFDNTGKVVYVGKGK
jgi:N-acetylmuramoyl-L-alanine amidase